MDHLPKIEGPTRSPLLRVPHLALQEYDRGDFYRYPSRRYFDPDITETDTAGWTDEKGYDLHQRTGIFQEWLFFGVINEAFAAVGVPVLQADFVDGPHVTTKNLVDYFRNFAEGLLKLPKEAQKSAVQRIERCLTIAIRYACFRPPGAMAVSLAACPDRWPIALSITSLVESMMILPFVPWSEGFLKAISDQRLSHASGLVTRRPPGRMEEILVNEMINVGWCRNQIAAFPSMDASTAYYFTRLPPVRKRDHSRCTARLCLCDQLQGDYKPQHTPQCTGDSCTFLGVTLDELDHIIQNNRLPIIKLEEQPGGEVSLKLVPREPSERYLALSHVWSHGLGNPKSNALPKCQVFRLLSLLRQFDTEWQMAGLWMDTICVPVSGPSRTLSIRRMGTTYRDASAVLVLDEDLQRVGSSGGGVPVVVDPVERAVRLGSSTWQRRLWTLQEASLNEPELVIFQFGDGPLALDRLVQDCLTCEPACLVSTLPTKAHDPLLHLGIPAHFRAYARDGPAGFADFEGESPLSAIFLILLETLARRTTSRAADEPVCVATIVDADPGFLLDESDAERRMEVFLKHLPRVPQDLLFLGGPKFADTPGMGWAPTSFLGKAGFAFVRYKWSTLTPEGLPVEADGVVLVVKGGSTTAADVGVSLRDTAVALKVEGHRPWRSYRLRNCTVVDEQDEEPIDLLAVQCPALIFREDVAAEKADFMACLVDIVDGGVNAEDPIVARFCALVSLNRDEEIGTENLHHGICFGRERAWIVG
ncbi:Het domain-containing protein [Lasiodiplodia theobromae]|uniref:Het domain-containing protein n=1 Tax=Lasiodiplodia theobromae TaxID=45133 RepID=UPI0015C35C2B|nr:Het domain-containing protein [Lasiodiplodia theobromae]KAF4544802.1 Het domain-containing protein [Lasiodiplodia theobromae]